MPKTTYSSSIMAFMETPYTCPQMPFRAQDMVVMLQDGRKGHTLSINSADEVCLAPMSVRVVPVLEAVPALATAGAPLFLHFPGGDRHPAGKAAGVSWYNDRGEGLVRITIPRHVIILELEGWAIPDAAKSIPQRGKRGPPRSMDLWLAIAALIGPVHFDVTYLASTTGINAFNLYDWLKRAEKGGLITGLEGGRRARYQISASQISLIGEYIRSTWKEWRKGYSMTRLRPTERYFISDQEWSTFEKSTSARLIPTGVTWLEGNGGGLRILTTAGNIPRLSFLCRESEWQQVVTDAHLAVRSARNRPYDSLAVVLPDAHPLWTIIQDRSDRQKTYDWPPGLRALEATNDVEARVRDAADAAWYEWLTTLQQNRQLHDAPDLR